MSQPPEGARVSYIGQAATGPELGAQGRLLAVTGSAGHVKWDDGALAGQLTLTAMADLVSTARCNDPSHDFSRPERDDMDDSLEYGRTASLDDDDDTLWDLGGWA